MVDLTLVSGIATTLKTAMDIAKTTKEISDMSTVKGKVIEMQDLILTAQSSAMAAQTQLYEILQENAELKRKVSAVDDWKSTASRYSLKDYGGGPLRMNSRRMQLMGSLRTDFALPALRLARSPSYSIREPLPHNSNSSSVCPVIMSIDWGA